METFHVIFGDGPIVAAAIHSGHLVRPDVLERFAVDESTRLREQDPFTDDLAALVPARLVGRRSRFETDLNRARPQAIYRQPKDAWGIEVWREQPSEAMLAESLANYDVFYAAAKALIETLIERHGRVVVLDLHSYNHRRDGAGGPPADEAGNPEINVGTGTLDRREWGELADRFMADLRAHDFLGRHLDVRENVKFSGGHFSQWVDETFPGRACALAIEFKKTFMDEWTGELDRRRFEALKVALRSTFPGLVESLWARTAAAKTTRG